MISAFQSYKILFNGTLWELNSNLSKVRRTENYYLALRFLERRNINAQEKFKSFFIMGSNLYYLGNNLSRNTCRRRRFASASLCRIEMADCWTDSNGNFKIQRNDAS